MDPGKTLGDHDPQPEMTRRHSGMLARRPLTVIAASYHCMSAPLSHRASPFNITRIDALKGKLFNLLDVRAIRQYPCSRRHDFVCRNIVSHFEQNRERQAVRQPIELWQRLNIRPFCQLGRSRFLERNRRLDQG